jgi:tRNA modification GTPase
MERSLAKMKQADLVLYLFDARDEKMEVRNKKWELDNQELNYLLLANKIDEIGEVEAREKFSDFEKLIFISAKQNLHTEVLKEKMVDAVLQGKIQTESTIVTNARHYHALKEAAKSLHDIQAGLDNKLPGDLLALDIRRCLHYLGEITGQVSNEDMLDYIFSKFCIGK